jgi:hypothetical protein
MKFKKSIFNKETEVVPDNMYKIKIYDYKNSWCFSGKDNKGYVMSPSLIAQLSFSPLVASTDLIVQTIAQLKKIKDPKKGFYVYFSKDYFIEYDFDLKLVDSLLDGWIYDASSENLKIDTQQKVWACSYLKLYFKEPPKNIYVMVKDLDEN